LNGLPNVSFIPPSTLAVNDWMKACDLVISKPGYSTVSEALLNRIPLAVLPLETPEAMTTLSILAERGWATTISLTGTDFASFDRLESLRIPILPEYLTSSDIGPIIKFMQS
jgi:spore coat polysaccharide biosynthesis predicted glycosyltransferase SpsG